MLKNLWEKLRAIVDGKDTMDEATFQAQHILLVNLDTRLKGVEDYLQNTPNHIGLTYKPVVVEPVVVEPVVAVPDAGEQTGAVA